MRVGTVTNKPHTKKTRGYTMLRSALVLSACLGGLGLVNTVFAEDDPEPGFNEATFKGLGLRSIGPAFMSGRISDIVIDPGDKSTWYVGVGSGGIFKTTNAGTTWNAIFEDEDAYSIGCITIDPNDPNVIWVGTGENISGRHAGYGAGLYRSLDGGANWENMGLEASERIGMIRIDPRDSNTIFVAAQGPALVGRRRPRAVQVDRRRSDLAQSPRRRPRQHRRGRRLYGRIGGSLRSARSGRPVRRQLAAPA